MGSSFKKFGRKVKETNWQLEVTVLESSLESIWDCEEGASEREEMDLKKMVDGVLKEAGGFPHSSVGKESACNAGDLGLISGLGRSPGEGKGYPLQYSGLENSTDCIVHGVAESWT